MELDPDLDQDEHRISLLTFLAKVLTLHEEPILHMRRDAIQELPAALLKEGAVEQQVLLRHALHITAEAIYKLSQRKAISY